MERQTFIEQIKRLEVTNMEAAGLSQDQLALRASIDAMVKGDQAGCIKNLKTVYQGQGDAELKGISAQLLFQQLFWDDRFQEIAELGLTADVAVDASYRAIALQLEKTQGRNPQYGADLHKDQLKLSISGSPIVDVVINGHAKSFWLDTGALLSVLSQETADLCGVVVREEDKLTVESSTDEQTQTTFGTVDRIQVGNFSAENTPFIILSTEALTISDPSIETIKIEGIIGWDLIKYLDMNLDYKNGQYEIRKPVLKPELKKNLLMDGYVMVQLQSKEGHDLCFGLDTGANRTSFNTPLIGKVGIEDIDKEVSKVGGVGGFREIERGIIQDLSLSINGTPVHFAEMRSSAHSPCDFFEVDGVLGSDIGQDGGMRIDYLNRWFELVR